MRREREWKEALCLYLTWAVFLQTSNWGVGCGEWGVGSEERKRVEEGTVFVVSINIWAVFLQTIY